MVAITVILALLLNSSLGKFLSFLGAFTCTPIAFTLPTMFHYKLVAKTQTAKIIDIAIIVATLIIMVFCSGFTIATWNKS
jgi:amino acid permease